MSPSRPPLGPSDAVVALRSLPRRFRAAFAHSGEQRPDDVAHRAGPSGRSAIEELHAATVGLAAWRRNLDRVLQKDDPELDAVDEPGPGAQKDQPVEDALAELAAAAEGLADRVSRVQAAEWSRTGRLAGAGTMTALDVAAEAVGSSIDHLRAAKQTVAAVSGEQPG